MCKGSIRIVFLWSWVLIIAGVGAAPAEGAGCHPEGERDAATVESCAIAGADYRLVRARTSVAGTVTAAIDLFRDSASCSEWQGMCAEELFFPGWCRTPIDPPPAQRRGLHAARSGEPQFVVAAGERRRRG